MALHSPIVRVYTTEKEKQYTKLTVYVHFVLIGTTMEDALEHFSGGGDDDDDEDW